MPDATARPADKSSRGVIRLFLSTLLTYPRRPWLWIWPLGTALLCAFVSSRISPMYDAWFDGSALSNQIDGVFFSAFLLACSVGFFTASVTGHFVQILVPPRGRLVPRLRAAALSANIVLTVAIVLGFAALWPHPVIVFKTGTLQGHPVLVPVHALAIAALLAAQLAWAQFAPITGSVSIFAWGALAFPAVREGVLRMLIGFNPALEAAMALTGAALFVTLWTAIARRRDRAYTVDPFAEALLRKLFGPDSRATPTPAPAPSTIPALAPPRTPQSRRRLHRRAAGGGTSPAVAGLVTGFALVALVYALRLTGLEKMDRATPRVLFFLASILPAVLVSISAMENRGPLVTHGLLLPQRRRHFVRDLGLAMLANLFTAWLAAILPLLLLVALDIPAPVRPTGADLAGMLAIAAAYQLFAFGVTAWLLRLNHRLAITTALAATCALGVPILIDAGLRVLPVTAVVVSLFTLTGSAFALTAYHRWANSEPPSAGPSKTAAAL